MNAATETTTGLVQILEQLSQALTPEMAQVLVDFRADEQTQARMDLLAEKCVRRQLFLSLSDN